MTVAELVRKAGKARMAGMTSAQRKEFSRLGVAARRNRSHVEYNGFDLTQPPPGVMLNRIVVKPGKSLFRDIAQFQLTRPAAAIRPLPAGRHDR